MTRSTRQARSKRSGNALLEFTLVGLPMMFVLITTFEMGRSMWYYHTLAYTAKEAARYSVVHGNYCLDPGNSCAKTLQDLATVIQTAGIGLDPAALRITLQRSSPPGATLPDRTLGPYTLEEMLALSNVYWPVAGPAKKDPGAEQGTPITITLGYEFQSALVMFWPGAHMNSILSLNFPATAREVMQF